MRITNNRLGLVATILMLTSAGTMAATDIYRWVDDEGVVHFSGQPPAHVEAEKVDTRAMSPASVEATADTVTDAASYNPAEDEKVEEEITPAQQIRNERLTARQKAAAEKATMEENCKNADFIISKLEPTPDVLITDEDGNVKRMDDDARMNKLNKAKDYAKANCNN